MVMRNMMGELALDASVKAIGTNPAAPLFIAPSTSGAVSQSRFRLASTGRVSLNIAGNLRGHIINQTHKDDGTTAIQRSVQIVRLAIFATATGWAQLYLNPTTGLPGTATRRPKMNALVQSGASAPVTPETSDPIDIRIDVNTTTALAGGVDTGVTFGIPGGVRTTLDLPPIVLTPGQSLGINTPFAGAADVSMSMYWAVV